MPVCLLSVVCVTMETRKRKQKATKKARSRHEWLSAQRMTQAGVCRILTGPACACGGTCVLSYFFYFCNSKRQRAVHAIDAAALVPPSVAAYLCAKVPFLLEIHVCLLWVWVLSLFPRPPKGSTLVIRLHPVWWGWERVWETFTYTCACKRFLKGMLGQGFHLLHVFVPVCVVVQEWTILDVRDDRRWTNRLGTGDSPGNSERSHLR